MILWGVALLELDSHPDHVPCTLTFDCTTFAPGRPNYTW